MSTNVSFPAFECALSVLRFSNGSAALYKVSDTSFDFFSRKYLPCLLGINSWKKKNEDLKRNALFLRELEKQGIHFALFDDIPVLPTDLHFFILFHKFFLLKEEESKEGKAPDKKRKDRLQRIESLLSLFVRKIYNGFIQDNDPSRKKNKKKPEQMPNNYPALYEMIKDYYSKGKGNSNTNAEQEKDDRPRKSFLIEILRLFFIIK